MKALYLRELRRLAFYALGPVPVMLAGALLGSKLGIFAQPGVLFSFSALLVGAGLVAPDRGSGAQSFLRRLPLGLGASLAARLAAALTWLTLVGVVAMGCRQIATFGGNTPLEFLFATAALAFFAGVAGSVATSRPLAAIGLGAFSGLLALGFFFGPLLAAGLRPDPGTISLLVALPVLALGVGATWAYRRGRLHVEGPLPVGLVAAGATAVALIGAGGTGAAWAAHSGSVAPELIPELLTSRPGEVAVVGLRGTPWYGPEERVVVFTPNEAPWVLPAQNVGNPTLGPKGRYLYLRRDAEGLGVVADLKEHTLREVQHERWPQQILWREGEPISAFALGGPALLLESSYGSGRPGKSLWVDLGRDVQELAGVDESGSLYFLSGADLVRVAGLDQAPLRETQSGEKRFPQSLRRLGLSLEVVGSAPEGAILREARVNPAGTAALALERFNDARLLYFDLERKTSRPVAGFGGIHTRPALGAIDRDAALAHYRIAFGPEGQAVVEHYAGRVVRIGPKAERRVNLPGWVVDLERAQTPMHARSTRMRELCRGVPAWSAEGERIALSRGELWTSEEVLEAAPSGRSFAFCGSALLRLPPGKHLAGDLELVEDASSKSAWGGAQ